MPDLKDIRSLSRDALHDWFVNMKLPAFRAKQVFEWLWKKNAASFDEMSNLPLSLRGELQQHFMIRRAEVSSLDESADGTRKLLFLLFDEQLVEGVLIPSGSRTTACISTQAGCRLACRFCATGGAGFKRDLQAAEIVDQFMHFDRLSCQLYGHPLDNAVYMGMGEPLLNTEAVMRATEIITDAETGSGFSPRRITLSTVGIPEGIRKLAEWPIKIQLAVSLHSAIQQKREQLMPVARKYDLEELSDSLSDYHVKTKERITFEYLLLGDINDGREDMEALALFCRRFPVKVNLINYNEFPGSLFRQSSSVKRDAFMSGLRSKNMVVHLRKSKGSDIAAACGQLAGPKK